MNSQTPLHPIPAWNTFHPCSYRPAWSGLKERAHDAPGRPARPPHAQGSRAPWRDDNCSFGIAPIVLAVLAGARQLALGPVDRGWPACGLDSRPGRSSAARFGGWRRGVPHPFARLKADASTLHLYAQDRRSLYRTGRFVCQCRPESTVVHVKTSKCPTGPRRDT